MKTLRLLPDVELPGLAFDACTTEHHGFLFRPLVIGPAAVTVKWYPESGSGWCVWSARVIPVPAGETVDIPLPAQFHGENRPMLVEPDRPPNQNTIIPVDFSGCTDRAILVLYRETVSAFDTAIRDGVTTDVWVSW